MNSSTSSNSRHKLPLPFVTLQLTQCLSSTSSTSCNYFNILRAFILGSGYRLRGNYRPPVHQSELLYGCWTILPFNDDNVPNWYFYTTSKFLSVPVDFRHHPENDLRKSRRISNQNWTIPRNESALKWLYSPLAGTLVSCYRVWADLSCVVNVPSPRLQSKRLQQLRSANGWRGKSREISFPLGNCDFPKSRCFSFRSAAWWTRRCIFSALSWLFVCTEDSEDVIAPFTVNFSITQVLLNHAYGSFPVR